jgi:hypothetical protein
MRYRDLSEVHEVVRRFEACEYSPAEFTHAHHLTVACFYLSTLPDEEALVRMRLGLRRFVEHHGKNAYHETITCFWMQACSHLLSAQPAGNDIIENINAAIQALGKKDMVFEHYTRDRVMSEAARRGWIAPDLKPIAGATVECRDAIPVDVRRP